MELPGFQPLLQRGEGMPCRYCGLELIGSTGLVVPGGRGRMIHSVPSTREGIRAEVRNEAVRNWVSGLLPTPHLLDAAWWFDDNTVALFHHMIESVPSGSGLPWRAKSFRACSQQRSARQSNLDRRRSCGRYISVPGWIHKRSYRRLRRECSTNECKTDHCRPSMVRS